MPTSTAGDEQQDRRLDVVARVDGQRQVRLGVEEVERRHGGQRGDDAGGPAAERGDGDDDDHQHQRGVGRVEERAEHGHHGTDADRGRDADGDPDRQPGRVDRRFGMVRFHH